MGRALKLLLDEMYTARIAEQLRRRGIDALAVQEVPELRAIEDRELFGVAQLDERVLVTENTADLVREQAAWLESHDSHNGLLLTTNRAFPRHDPRTIGRLVEALAELTSTVDSVEGLVRWLGPAAQ